MNNVPSFNFFMGTDGKSIFAKRIFYTTKERVWKYFTTAELLDEWWAPNPYRATTKSYDFSVGGTWHYLVIESSSSWNYCRADFKEIFSFQHFSAEFALCDKYAVPNTYFPKTLWRFDFMGTTDTTVKISMHFEKAMDMKQYLDRGLQTNMINSFQKLDKLLAIIK